MGLQDQPVNQQMNLTLMDQRAVSLSVEKEKELALALLELLLNAAAESAAAVECRGNGGHDEFQAHC